MTPPAARHIFDFHRGIGHVWDEQTCTVNEKALSDDTLLAANVLGQTRTHPHVETLRRLISNWHVSDLKIDTASQHWRAPTNAYRPPGATSPTCPSSSMNSIPTVFP